MAPEMVASDLGYDYSVDYWSVGVLLFEMLTGTYPAWTRESLDRVRVWPDSNAMRIAKQLLHVRQQQHHQLLHNSTSKSSFPCSSAHDFLDTPSSNATKEEGELAWDIFCVHPEFCRDGLPQQCAPAPAASTSSAACSRSSLSVCGADGKATVPVGENNSSLHSHIAVAAVAAAVDEERQLAVDLVLQLLTTHPDDRYARLAGSGAAGYGHRRSLSRQGSARCGMQDIPANEYESKDASTGAGTGAGASGGSATSSASTTSRAVKDMDWSAAVRSHPFFAAVDWALVDRGGGHRDAACAASASASASASFPVFDRRVGCMELLPEYDLAEDVVSAEQNALFAGY
jgi:hypothetical protein